MVSWKSINFELLNLSNKVKKTSIQANVQGSQRPRRTKPQQMKTLNLGHVLFDFILLGGFLKQNQTVFTVKCNFCNMLFGCISLILLMVAKCIYIFRFSHFKRSYISSFLVFSFTFKDNKATQKNLFELFHSLYILDAFQSQVLSIQQHFGIFH